MITVADIFNSSKIELFLDSPDSEFYKKCRKREQEIKQTIVQARMAFNIHIQELNRNRQQLLKWKKDQIRLCLTNLGKYLEDLINELNKQKIESYCRLAETLDNGHISFVPDIVLLITNSYQGAVETDLHWVTDLTMADSIDISTGTFDFAKLQRYLPGRISEIRNLLQELNAHICVADHVGSITEAIECFNSEYLKGSNVLLITVIEGIVRLLGACLKEKQEIIVDLTNKRKYASLECFLTKIPWKKDLPIDKIQYGLITGDYSLSKALNEDTTLTNLSSRLGFLCRRFKENRNNILHGEDTNYSNVLNSFLNFSALKEVLLTVSEYEKLYGN